MFKKPVIFAALIIAMMAKYLYSQVEMPPILHEDLPNYYLDMVNVRGNNAKKSQLRVFIKVPYDELQFLKTESDSFKAKYEVSVVIFDDENYQTDGKIWEKSITVPTFAQTNLRDRYSFTSTKFNLEPGNYKVSVGLMDLDTRKTLTQKTKLLIRDFSRKKLSISDVLYADSVSVSANGTVTPFPHVKTPRKQAGSLYGFFYLYTRKNYGPFSIRLVLRNAKRKKVFQDTREFSRIGNATPIVFTIPDSQLAHGNYTLKIRVKAGRYKAELESSFTIHWQGVPVTASDLDMAIRQLQYIARGKEMKKITKAKPERQIREFIKFWKLRDPTPGTEKNEIMDEYYRRVQYANEHFGGIREGWKTDMGMVYILLGPPNDVERNPLSSGLATSYFTDRPIKAWEIWQYYDLNRLFIFVDENGFGDFRLENPQALDDLYNIFRY